MFDRGSVKYEIYTRLNKTAAARGFYTDDKANSAVQEAIDGLATDMMLADHGWLKKIDYLDVPAGCRTLQIQRHMSMILEVRYMVADSYLPLVYDAQWGQPTASSAAGTSQSPFRYRIVDNRFYFNPAITAGGTKFLEVEFMAYPRLLAQDADKLEPQFDRAMFWCIVYRAMNVMASSMTQFQKSWAKELTDWEERAQTIIWQRNKQSTTIAEYEGG